MSNFAILSFIAASVSLVYTTIAPIFPLLAFDKHIPQEFVGQIIGIYSLSSIVSSPFILVLMKKFHKQTLIIVGILLMTLTLFVMSSLNFIENRTTFIALSFTCRIGQGLADSIVNVSILTLIQISSQKSKYQRNIFILQTCKSIGFSMGPIFASFVNQVVGFSGVFIILGSYYGCCAFFTKLALRRVGDRQKEEVNQHIQISDNDDDQSTNYTNVNPQDPIQQLQEHLLIYEQNRIHLQFKNLLQATNVTLALIQVFMIITTFSYWEPLLSLHLMNLGVSQAELGYYFASNTVLMIITGFGAAFIPPTINPRSIILVFNVFQSINLLLIGPSNIFSSLNCPLVLITIGLSLNGLLFPFSYSTIIPTIQRTISQIYPNHDKQSVSQKVSVLFTISKMSSITLSPIVSSLLSGAGFTLGRISQIFASVVFLFTVLYFVLSGDFIRLFRCKKKSGDGKQIVHVLQENYYYPNKDDEQQQQLCISDH